MAAVIIIDDSKISRQKLRAMLEHYGHTVLAEGADGKEAVALYREQHPDIITLDLEMPMMNGNVAAENIIRADAAARIIMITTSMNKKELAIAQKRGVKAILAKPVDAQKLADVIDNLMKES